MLNLNYAFISYWNFLSSTNSCLYNRLVEEPSIITLANTYTTSQLIEEYKKHLYVDRNENGEYIGENELTVYAVLIALYLKNEIESRDFLWNLTDNIFMWIQPLRKYCIEKSEYKERENN